MSAEMVKFGLIDNGLLIIITLLSIKFAGRIRMPWNNVKGINPTFAALMGAALGNTASDAAAALGIGVEEVIGVAVGCLIPLILTPIYRVLINRIAPINT